MSSSNIIKSDASAGLTPFRLGSIISGDTPSTKTTEAFTPVDFRKSSVIPRANMQDSRALHIQMETETLEPGNIQISEEELDSRLTERYRQGVQDGREQAEKGLDNVFKAMRSGISELAGLREHILRSSESDLLKLSVMIARKVIQQEVSCSKDVLATIVNSALSDCIHLDRITIRLNPQDCEIVSGSRDRFLGTLDSETKVILLSDETLLPGDCVIDSTTGVIDARIETQLEEIYRCFNEEAGISSIEAPESVDLSDN